MATAMLLRIARGAIAADKPEEAAAVALRLDDDILMTGKVDDALAGYSLDDESTKVVAHIAKWLRERRLFVRAIAFSRKMTNDPYDQDDEQGLALQELLADIEDPVDRRDVGDRIAEISLEALEALGQQDAIVDWPGDLSDYIWVDGLRNAEHLTAPTKAMLVTAEGEVVPFSAEAPETPQWATAYQQTRDTAFVFSPPEIALPVALAAERFLREQYGVRLPGPALIAARRSKDRARAERKVLEDAGFYAGSPLDLLPLPQPLWQGDADRRLEGIASRLHGYCPPLVDPSQAGRDRFEPGRIRDFIRQFKADELIEAALDTLQAIEIIDRRAVVAPLRGFLADHPEFQDASLVVFGSAADSSSVATYFSMDLGSQFTSLRARDIGEALVLGKPILFVDDFIGSGRQSEAIVRAWFGDDSLAIELGEERRKLPDQAQELLRNSTTGFCFAAGLTGGPDRLKSALDDLSLPTVEIRVGRQEESLPTVISAGDLDADARSAFVTRCEEVGRALLEGQPEEKRENRVLGYGNKGLLLTFPYNTPSQTLTCLWERGEVDDKPWTPLLPRRRKT